MKQKQRLIFIFILVFISACQSPKNQTLELARVEENSVEVSITLAHAEDGQVFLSATFTPTNDELHLYSKNIPKGGIEGLGRPALLELAPDSNIQSKGALVESAPAQIPFTGPQDLLVYPAGAITLSMPIALPSGSGWRDEKVIITYMACTNYTCRPPVEGKIIPIQIPENEAFN